MLASAPLFVQYVISASSTTDIWEVVSGALRRNRQSVGSDNANPGYEGTLAWRPRQFDRHSEPYNSQALVRHRQQTRHPMTFLSATFYYLAAGSVASGLLAVTRRNPVHSMLWVLALFLHVAGIFLLMDAEFLAAVQVIVYAGAILVFYVFVVMLLDLPDEEARPRFGRHWPLAAAVGLSIPILAWAARAGRSVAPSTSGLPSKGVPPKSLSAVGMALFGPFALPFEIASLLLLAAIIGTVVVARRRAVRS